MTGVAGVAEVTGAEAAVLAAATGRFKLSPGFAQGRAARVAVSASPRKAGAAPRGRKTMNLLKSTAAAATVAAAMAAASLAASAGAADAAAAAAHSVSPAYTCPSTGAACFYGETGFNDDFGVYYPNTGYGEAYGTVGLRNRTGYWLCLENTGNGAKWAQAPYSETSNIGDGWNTVDALVYFHSNSAC